jgi:hypothetical protein
MTRESPTLPTPMPAPAAPPAVPPRPPAVNTAVPPPGDDTPADPLQVVLEQLPKLAAKELHWLRTTAIHCEQLSRRPEYATGGAIGSKAVNKVT